MITSARSKRDMISSICIYLTDMQEEILAAGMKHDVIEIPDGWPILPITTIREAYKWLRQIYTHNFKDEIYKVRELLPKMLWKRYEDWGDFTDHREVKMLQEVQTRFRGLLISKDRPIFFKKGKIRAEIKRLRKKKTRTLTK